MRAGLSTRLLLLTILFVMVSEVLIYVPSIANFRLTWLGDRLAAARIAALVLDAGADGSTPKTLENELLMNVGAKMIAMKRGDTRRVLAAVDAPETADRSYDLRDGRSLSTIVAAFEALTAAPGRVLRVADAAPIGADFVEVLMEEAPLKAAMLDYSRNIMLLSLIISILTAGFVYLALNRLLVRPILKLTAAIMLFREKPEDRSRIVKPSGRRDEIGLAERELAAMQTDLADTLRQKTRLAALGLAVAKINHDLRNLLASVQVLSEGVNAIEDPRVQRFAPKLMRALDRAIAFCQATLAYGQAREPPPERRSIRLRPFADEVAETVGLSGYGQAGASWVNAVSPDLTLDADPDQLFRILMNLMRNSMQALEGRGEVRVAAGREGGRVWIDVVDTGPGVPEGARARLFEAFHSSAASGGTGLGLAIAAELAHAHGGEITLMDSAQGAAFRVTIPERRF